jgi:2-dehydro-3-deoxy-D-gluconate 5-dehydrogenase
MLSVTLSQLCNLVDQVALVTGGGRGIGQATAMRLAEAGADMVVTDIDLESAKATARMVNAFGRRSLALRSDVAAPQEADRVIGAAMKYFGRLDILVNNAGVMRPQSALEMTAQEWNSVIDLNLSGTFFHCQAAAKCMRDEKRAGRIVNLASINAFLPYQRLSHYDASKGAIVSLTKSLAKEFGPLGIRVNAVAPGGTLTPGAAEFGSRLAATAQPANVSIRSVLGRYAQPDEIARVVVFLVCELSSYVTGTTLIVDGGRLLT